MSTSESNKDDLRTEHRKSSGDVTKVERAIPLRAGPGDASVRRTPLPPPIPSNARRPVRARTTSQGIRARPTLPPPTGHIVARSPRRAVPPPIPPSAMRAATPSPDDSIDIPIEVEEPVRSRPRGQGTVPPVDHAPAPFIITPSPETRRDGGRLSHSIVTAQPVRFERASPDASIDDGEETFGDDWFQPDHTDELRAFETASTRRTPREPNRSASVLWLLRIASALCIAGLAFLVLRRDIWPSSATTSSNPMRTTKDVQRPPLPPAVTTPTTAPMRETIAVESAVQAPSPPAAASLPATSPKKKHKRRAHGEGTLMVSTKPPCEIVIDGVATVLTTPQRALKLRAGKHTLTLFNFRFGVEVTLPISIEANKTTKVIRDLMPLRRVAR